MTATRLTPVKRKLPVPLRWLFRLGWLLLGIYGILCLVLFFQQRKLVFYPQTTVTKTPADVGLAYQDLWLTVGGERMHGWWIPAPGRPKKTLLYLHGNGINMGANVNQARNYRDLGMSVLLIDYRGYGRSEGAFPSEASVYADAERAWQYLTRERRIPASEIVIYGHSLGGAVAIELATRHPEASGLIVQSSFTSMQAMAYRQGPLRYFPIPLILNQRFDSLSKVGKLRLPALFIHGTNDRSIPYSMSRQLHAAAPQPKQLLFMDGAGHNNGDKFFNQPRYVKVVRDFATR